MPRLAGVLIPGVVVLAVLKLLAGSPGGLATAARWLVVPALTMVIAGGAAARLARMGYGRPAIARVGSGLAVLAGAAAVWGLRTGDLFRALGLALLAAASVGFLCAVVAVVSAIRADRRAAARHR